MTQSTHSSRPAESAIAPSCRGITFPDGEGAFHPRRVGRFTHGFHDHPLMEIDALCELGVRLEKAGKGQVKYQHEGATSGDPLHVLTSSEKGFGVREVFARIAEPRSWIALYEVQTDPEYREFIHQVLESVRHITEPLDPGTFDRNGFIFISAPPAATPFHIDRENNFFLQCKGRKRMTVWRPDDRVVVPEVEVENTLGMHLGSRVKFQETFWERAAINEELKPGEGVYMPSSSPHTTNTEFQPAGSEHPYSVSIGVVYYTKATRRAAYCYSWNHTARKFGLPVKPPYQSPTGDRVRSMLGRGVIAAKRIFKGFKVPEGM